LIRDGQGLLDGRALEPFALSIAFWRQPVRPGGKISSSSPAGSCSQEDQLGITGQDGRKFCRHIAAELE